MCLKVDSKIQKPFAFINYSNHEEALTAFNALNETDVFGKNF